MRALGGEDCLVSHQHKFVYLAIPKTGSSTTRVLLISQLCGHDPHSPGPGDHRQNMEYLRHSCASDVLASVKCSEVTQRHSNYTFFTTVRDPWLRAGSCWTYVRRCYANFAERSEGHILPPYPSFHSALEEGGYLTLPRTFMSASSSHVGPQAPFLIDANTGQSTVDYRIRLDHLEEDLACAVSSLSATALKEKSATLVGHVVRKSFVHTNPEGLAERPLVQKFYSTDFLLLGSATLGVSATTLDFELGCSPLECTGKEPCQPQFCEKAETRNTPSVSGHRLETKRRAARVHAKRRKSIRAHSTLVTRDITPRDAIWSDAEPEASCAANITRAHCVAMLGDSTGCVRAPREMVRVGSAGQLDYMHGYVPSALIRRRPSVVLSIASLTRRRYAGEASLFLSISDITYIHALGYTLWCDSLRLQGTPAGRQSGRWSLRSRFKLGPSNCVDEQPSPGLASLVFKARIPLTSPFHVKA